MHMDSIRTEKISVNLTPELAESLNHYAAQNHWSRSTAAAVLIERGLVADSGKDTGLADQGRQEGRIQ
jgi:hypothetical protein